MSMLNVKVKNTILDVLSVYHASITRINLENFPPTEISMRKSLSTVSSDMISLIELHQRIRFKELIFLEII